jgi:hypothetical protein
MQYRTRYTAKKGMRQESLSMGSKNNRIAPFFIRSIQDFFRGMATRDENLGHE